MTDHTRDARGALTDEQRDSINSPFNACCNREACRALLAQSSAKTDDEIYDLFEKETGFSVESHATIEEADILGFARALLGAPRAQFDAEALIRECVPGGSICDPQAVADAIRAYAAPRQPGKWARGCRICGNDSPLGCWTAAKDRRSPKNFCKNRWRKCSPASKEEAMPQSDKCSHGKGWETPCLQCELVSMKEFVGRWDQLVIDAKARIAELEPAAASAQQSGYRCADCKAPLRLGYTCDVCDSDAAEDVETASAQQDEREAFEAWYTQNAFDYERNPIGSRECGLQWKAWQAGAVQRVQADAGAVACKRCGAQTVAQCNDMNCHFLEAGNGDAGESDKP